MIQSYLIIGSDETEIEKEINQITENKFNLAKVNQDLTIVEPEKTTIGIEQVRNLKRTIFQKAYKDIKLIIFKNAQKMTVVAQNSLLKILEEPPENTVIILTANKKSAFLQTILSRTKIITLKSIIKEKGILPESLFGQLTEISSVADPEKWLDNQIQNNYYDFLQKPENPTGFNQKMEKFIAAKKQIVANVYPKLVLANLIFGLEE